jgi:hypothetical protein
MNICNYYIYIYIYILGKSTTLVHLLSELMAQETRSIHCTAASNKAICVLAKKYLEKVLSENADGSLANFAIVGEQSRLEISNDSNILAKIQIDMRATRLLESKSCIFELLPGMLDFVKFCKVGI